MILEMCSRCNKRVVNNFLWFTVENRIYHKKCYFGGKYIKQYQVEALRRPTRPLKKERGTIGQLK